MIIPTLRYEDARGALEFLERAFGFERHAVYENEDGAIGHAELRSGRGMVMLGTRGAGDPRYEPGRAVIYVVVANLDAHHARAQEAGAEIIQPPVDRDYGSREYAALDPEGNVWTFGTYDPFG